MDIRFKDTRAANASAETFFEVIADYPAFPRFNTVVLKMTVVARNDGGVEFLADRSTAVERGSKRMTGV